jgi:uncharacterized protein
MIRTFKAPAAALVLAVGLGGSVAAGPFEEAADAAYDKGDHATATQLLRPLAEKGNANAQYTLGLMHARGQGVAQNNLGQLCFAPSSDDRRVGERRQALRQP